jgi:hypothetical protein
MTDTTNKTSAIELGRRFERARDALFSWKEYDDGTEFFVKNLTMIDRRNGKAIACVVEYNGPEKEPNQDAGYVIVHNRFATMFSGVHLTVSEIPADGDWERSHQKNLDAYPRNMREIYEDDSGTEDKAQAMLATRRQMIIYALVFKDHKTVKVDRTPSEYERLLVADARILNQDGQYIRALAEMIGQSDGKKDE